MKFKKYVYGNNPEMLPIDCDGYIEGYDEYCIEAGFNPDDEEVNVCTLSDDWNGHKKGSIIVTDIMVQGSEFAIIIK